MNIATSADGFIARPDGSLDWLTRREAPAGGYGLAEFERAVDAKILGRKTFDRSRELGATFQGMRYYVFSRAPRPSELAAGVEWVTEPVAVFADRLRNQSGKNVWMMGGGDIIGAFLDENAIDELIITAIPVLIGEGLPLFRAGHRAVPLQLLDLRQFPDGVVQRRYGVKHSSFSPRAVVRQPRGSRSA